MTRRYPFPTTPASWYHLAWSDEVSAGRPRRVRAFGLELAAVRNAGGVVEVHGGARRWRVLEQNGMVVVHFDPTGAPPSFELPEVAECRTWMPVGRLEWTLRSHIQEVVENAVDLTHFELLHKFAEPARLVRFDMHGHNFAVTVAAPKLVLGIPRPTELTIEYHGMGLALGRVVGPFPFLNLVTNLPVDDEHMRLRFTMFVRAPRLPGFGRALAAFLRWHVRTDVEDELRVLEHKRYLERPVLAAGDGPIMKVRRWCEQFYPSSEAQTRAA
jgi:3-ketosteroid 9alpha-monooxygenase subunit A